MSASINIVCAVCNAVNRVPRQRLVDQPVCGKCRQKLFDGEPVTLEAENFRQFISRTEIPVVVDFWASWCGPCKMMAPFFTRVASLKEPNVRFAKLDTEQAPNIATQYHIRGIPTLIIYQNGQEIARHTGAMDEQALSAFVEKNC